MWVWLWWVLVLVMYASMASVHVVFFGNGSGDWSGVQRWPGLLVVYLVVALCVVEALARRVNRASGGRRFE